MPAKHRDSRPPAPVSTVASGAAASIAPVPISLERRALIEAEVAQLSAVARKVAATLPLSAEASDYVRILDAAGAQ